MNAGERGPHGDHGQTGAQGEAGAAGAIGQTGSGGLAGLPGERGPHGDHGQAGDRGETGLDGKVGDTGRDGLAGLPGERGQSGDVGRTGPTGERGKIGVTRKQVLALFLFLAFALTLLAWRSEVNSQQIEDTIELSCELDAKIARNVNAVLDQTIRDTRRSDLPAEQVRERIEVFTAAQIQPLPC